MIVDLRSDTVTQPTAEMLQAMMHAPVGDDVFGEDPSVMELEQKTANLFGMEAALFCPSGTMANQIAIKCHTKPMEEVICDAEAHIYLYEGGGIAYNSMISARLLSGDRGRINASQVLANINPDNVHHPKTTLVALENTSNKGGGSCYSTEDIASISQVCKDQQLALHLDGARVFNALVATGESPATYGKYFDTISVCLSKGLGAPVGSVLLGNKATLYQARRIRKVLGGGMRQAGFMAAAGIYAIEHNITRLKEDHIRAQVLGAALAKQAYVTEVFPVETNIVIARLVPELSTNDFIAKLLAKNIKIVAFGPQLVRFVTHLQFTDDMLQYTINTINSL